MPHLLAANEKIALDFTFSGAIGIGRHIANSLPLPDPEVSRYHAQIFPRGDAFIITDLESRNGVYINGQKIKEHLLRPGDEVCLGNTLLFFDPIGDQSATCHFSEQGSRIWKQLPEINQYAKAEVTTFSPLELEDFVSQWLDRQEKTAVLPFKLRADFLKFVLEMDKHNQRGALCNAALRFLENSVGSERGAVFALDMQSKNMEVLARHFSDDSLVKDRDFTVHKDILRIVVDAGRAVYCPQLATDFRFKTIFKKNAEYLLQTFIAVPIAIPGGYPAFLYLDQPAGSPKYDFKALLQAYVIATLLGKALYWYHLGGKKKKA